MLTKEERITILRKLSQSEIKHLTEKVTTDFDRLSEKHKRSSLTADTVEQRAELVSEYTCKAKELVNLFERKSAQVVEQFEETINSIWKEQET